MNLGSICFLALFVLGLLLVPLLYYALAVVKTIFLWQVLLTIVVV